MTGLWKWSLHARADVSVDALAVVAGVGTHGRNPDGHRDPLFLLVNRK
jgi:hypothetical protein